MLQTCGVPLEVGRSTEKESRHQGTSKPDRRQGYLSTVDQSTSCLKSGEIGGWSKGEGETTVTTEQGDNKGEKQKWRVREATAFKQGEGKGMPSTEFPKTPFYNPKT